MRFICSLAFIFALCCHPSGHALSPQKVESKTLPNGNHLIYTYDGHGDLKQLELKNGSKEQTLSWIQFYYAFDDCGRLAHLVTSEGKSANLRLDDSDASSLAKNTLTNPEIAGCRSPKEGPRGPKGPPGSRGPAGPSGATGECSCNNGCLVGLVVTFFDVEQFPPGSTGTSETFGPTTPIDQSIEATAWSRVNPGQQLVLFNKNEGVGEQGLGIDGTADHEITVNNFIQLDLSKLLALNPIPNQVILTIQSIQTGEGFSIYESSTSGVLGTLVVSGNNPDNGGVVQSVPIPLTNSTPQFLNITSLVAPGDILLSAISIPQCEAITAPLLLVVDESIDPESILGSFIGQLAFFQSDDTLRTWNGTEWVPA